jgi:hypothetical protein
MFASAPRIRFALFITGCILLQQINGIPFPALQFSSQNESLHPSLATEAIPAKEVFFLVGAFAKWQKDHLRLQSSLLMSMVLAAHSLLIGQPMAAPSLSNSRSQSSTNSPFSEADKKQVLDFFSGKAWTRFIKETSSSNTQDLINAAQNLPPEYREMILKITDVVNKILDPTFLSNEPAPEKAAIAILGRLGIQWQQFNYKRLETIDVYGTLGVNKAGWDNLKLWLSQNRPSNMTSLGSFFLSVILEVETTEIRFIDSSESIRYLSGHRVDKTPGYTQVGRLFGSMTYADQKVVLVNLPMWEKYIDALMHGLFDVRDDPQKIPSSQLRDILGRLQDQLGSTLRDKMKKFFRDITDAHEAAHAIKYRHRIQYMPTMGDSTAVDDKIATFDEDFRNNISDELLGTYVELAAISRGNYPKDFTAVEIGLFLSILNSGNTQDPHYWALMKALPDLAGTPLQTLRPTQKMLFDLGEALLMNRQEIPALAEKKIHEHFPGFNLENVFLGSSLPPTTIKSASSSYQHEQKSFLPIPFFRRRNYTVFIFSAA